MKKLNTHQLRLLRELLHFLDQHSPVQLVISNEDGRADIHLVAEDQAVPTFPINFDHDFLVRDFDFVIHSLTEKGMSFSISSAGRDWLKAQTD